MNIDFSEQQLIDCDKSNFRFNGGWPYKTINCLAQLNGLETEKDYPLRANYSGPWNFEENEILAKIKWYLSITHNESIIKHDLYERGPLSILLDFTGLFHYKSGVASPYWCSTARSCISISWLWKKNNKIIG